MLKTGSKQKFPRRKYFKTNISAIKQCYIKLNILVRSLSVISLTLKDRILRMYKKVKEKLLGIVKSIIVKNTET